MVLKCKKCKSIHCNGEQCIEFIANELKQLQTSVRRLNTFVDTNRENSNKALKKANQAIENIKTITGEYKPSKSQDQQPSTSSMIDYTNMEGCKEIINAQQQAEVNLPQVSSSEESNESKYIRKVVMIKKNPNTGALTKPFYMIKRVQFKEPLIEQGNQPEVSAKDADNIAQPEIQARSTTRIISNDFKTQSHPPEDKLKVSVQAGEKLLNFSPPTKATGKRLYERVRQELGLEAHAPITLALVNHVIINEDSKSLWAYGIRNYPAIVSSIPEPLAQGDRMNLIYGSKGLNVNGNYIAYPKQILRDRSKSS